MNSEVRDVCGDFRYLWPLIVQAKGSGSGENAGSTGFLPTTDPTRQVNFTSRGENICCPYRTSVPSCGNRLPDTSNEQFLIPTQYQIVPSCWLTHPQWADNLLLEL